MTAAVALALSGSAAADRPRFSATVDKPWFPLIPGTTFQPTPDGRVKNRAGSWRAGVDGARAGILLQEQAVKGGGERNTLVSVTHR